MRIAHVGSYDGQSDMSQFQVALKWLERNAPAFYSELHDAAISDEPGRCERDHINLDNGRDFLREKKTYDLVILHHIFSAEAALSFRPGRTGAFNISRLHSPQNWRRRLIESEAHFIICLGNYDEVAGRYLGDLDGSEKLIDTYLLLWNCAPSGQTAHRMLQWKHWTAIMSGLSEMSIEVKPFPQEQIIQKLCRNHGISRATFD